MTIKEKSYFDPHFTHEHTEAWQVEALAPGHQPGNGTSWMQVWEKHVDKLPRMDSSPFGPLQSPRGDSIKLPSKERAPLPLLGFRGRGGEHLRPEKREPLNSGPSTLSHMA